MPPTTPAKSLSVAPAVLCGLLLLALYALQEAPGPLSAPLPFRSWLAVWAWLGIFLLSLLGWGAFFLRFSRPVKLPLLAAALLGSAFFSALMGLLGGLGWLGGQASWICRLVLWAGFLWLPTNEWRRGFREAARRARDPSTLLVYAALLAACACFLKGATLPNVVQDVFSYHLNAPWRWWSAGRIGFDPAYPHLYLASYWEYLYLWAFPLLGSQGNSLFSVLAFAQLLHVTLGLIGSLSALYALLRLARTPRPWSLVAALSGVTVFPLLWTAWHAKNDYGSVFWFLGSLFFFLQLRFVPAGLLLGQALAAKASLLFSAAVLPFLLVPFLFRRGRTLLLPFLSRFPACLSLAALPYLARNLLGTGNPFFPPFLSRSGPSLVSESMREISYAALGEAAFDLRLAAVELARLQLREPLLTACALLFLVFLARRARPRATLLLGVATFPAVPAAVWLGSWLGDLIYLRYLAAPLCLANAVPLAVVGRSGARLRGKAWSGALLLAVLAALFLSRSFVPWAELLPLRPGPDHFSAYLREVPGASCKAWMSESLPESASILSLEDDFLFLFPRRNVRVALHDPKADARFRSAAGLDGIFAAVRAEGTRYVYETNRAQRRRYYARSEELSSWVRGQGRAVVFRGDDCTVVDLFAVFPPSAGSPLKKRYYNSRAPAPWSSRRKPRACRRYS